MSGRAECQIIGRWRILESDQWDRDYLDLIDPAFIAFDIDGHGELAFGVVTVSLRLDYARTVVFFTFEGSDEGESASARSPIFSGTANAAKAPLGQAALPLPVAIGGPELPLPYSARPRNSAGPRRSRYRLRRVIGPMDMTRRSGIFALSTMSGQDADTCIKCAPVPLFGLASACIERG